MSPRPAKQCKLSDVRTREPGCVDVVGAVVLRVWVEVDPGGVGGEEVGRAVLALVADLKGGRELRLWRVVRGDNLKRRK